MADLPELIIDNPGGDWLQRKLEEAQEDYRTAPSGSSRRNLGGSNVTGYWRGASDRTGIWNLSPGLLKDIPGALGEEAFRNDSVKLRMLQESIKKSGYDPSQATILIQVREDGKPFIVEGNHRVAEGLLSGRSTIPVEIQYLRGGEAAKGPLSPERLRQANEPRSPDKSKLPAVIDAASAASQLARTQADDPRPKGLRRGLGSLKRAPWMALAQMTWENLTPKQREVAEQYGKEAYGSFEDAWKAASAWSERNRLPTGVEGGLQWVMDRLGFSETPAQLDDFFENMGEDGVGIEYPELYEALERYTYGVDSTGLVDAFNDPRYPEYKKVLQINLRRIFPEGKIPVQRVEGYIGQYTEDHDGKRTFLERPKRTRTRFEISPEDVIFSGLEGESELIIDGKKYGYDRDFLSVSIKPMDPERKASGGFVDKPLYQDARMIG